MKKLMLAAMTAAAFAAFADESKAAASEKVEADEIENESSWLDNFHGYANYGIYSGYQLYGSLVNSEPTAQSYAELAYSLKFDDLDLGALSVGFWHNNDLTDKRRGSYGKAFNEQDYNIKWGRTFWFDDDKTWGLDYKCGFVWYYYPHHRNSTFVNGHTLKTDTTMDFNHWFTLKSPFVDLFLTYVREYHENNANLWEFGAKRDFSVLDNLSLTPSITFVNRSHRYNWCFATAGFTEFHNGGLATMKIGLDANYWFNKNVGLFAKVAYCQTLDNSLRDAAEHGSGADYGQYKDFAWGGFGVQVAF